MRKSAILKSILKITVPIILLIGLVVSPILHQTLPTRQTSYFSILDSLQEDIAEKQFLTPYAISTMFTDVKVVNNNNVSMN